MITVKNISNAPRGIHDRKGRHVLIYPGQSRSVDLNNVGLLRLKTKTSFEFSGSLVSSDNALSMEELQAEAKALEIEVDTRWNEKRLSEEIQKVKAKKEFEKLLEEAEALEIEVDNRWREKRLREEIQKAKDEIELAELLEEAETLGISVKRRWTTERIKTEIQKVRDDAVHDTNSN